MPQGLVVRFGLGLDALCNIKSNQKKITATTTPPWRHGALKYVIEALISLQCDLREDRCHLRRLHTGHINFVSERIAASWLCAWENGTSCKAAGVH